MLLKKGVGRAGVLTSEVPAWSSLSPGHWVMACHLPMLSGPSAQSAAPPRVLLVLRAGSPLLCQLLPQGTLQKEEQWKVRSMLRPKSGVG